MKLSQVATLFNIISLVIVLVTVLFAELNNRAGLLLGATSMVLLASTIMFYWSTKAERK